VPELIVPAAVSTPTAQPFDLSAGAQKRAEAVRLAAHQPIRLPSWSATSVTAEARHIAKIARPVEGDLDDPTRVLVADTPSRRVDAGMAWGTLIHGLLEHAMRQRNASREDLMRLAMWLTVEQQELRPVLDDAVAVVETFARSEFWQLASCSEHLVEVPFLFADAQDSLLAGVIDLVFKTRGGWEIVDYKTDLDLTDDVSARYHLQLDAYRRALAACGIKTVRASIRPVRTGSDVKAMKG
jgi:ATP-dependent exoDNAse (exonuclease V) beta subunit